jgi:hypothetical protein
MRKKRGYQRETPQELVRDYTLFAIACEGGKTEPQYFSVFQHASTRIKVDIIQDIEAEVENSNTNKSSPAWVLDRAIKYIEKEGLLEEDKLYFVIDRDRWEFDQIKTLADYCEQHQNWNLVISNPCFEVWLYFHLKSDIVNSQSDTCRKLKTEISSFTEGGYHPYKFIVYLQEAIKNAKSGDSNTGHFMPNIKETRVYQLAEAIIETIGISNFNNFIENTLPTLTQKDLNI